MATSLVAQFRRNALAVAAALAVVAELAVVADPAVVAGSAVAEPVAGVVESMRGQAEQMGLSPVQHLLCGQGAVSRSPLP